MTFDMLLTEQAQCNGLPCTVQDSTSGNSNFNDQYPRVPCSFDKCRFSILHDVPDSISAVCT